MRRTLLSLAVLPAMVGAVGGYSSLSYWDDERAAADCSQTFFPISDPADRYLGLAGGTTMVASAAPGFFPVRSAYDYRQADRASGTVTSYESRSSEDLPVGTRLDVFRSDDIVVSTASTVTAAGECARLIFRSDPPVIQVGLRASAIGTTNKLYDLYGQELDGISDLPRKVALPAVEPGQAQLIVRAYLDGRPAPNANVQLMSAPGEPVPGYGRTLAHMHIAEDRDNAVRTLVFQDKARGEWVPETYVVTDGEGRYELPIKGGYRGGWERVIGYWTLGGGQTVAGWQDVLIAHGQGLRHFSEAGGFSHDNPPFPSLDFPFVLVGATKEHPWNHWVLPGLAGRIRSTLDDVWRNDQARLAKDDVAEPRRFIALNDMSLEYGGTFHLKRGGQTPQCTLDEGSDGYWPHATHDRGIDVDMSPCYTNGSRAGDRVSAGDCAAGRGIRVDERRLFANIVGRGRGALFVHGMKHVYEEDNAAFHYHIRFKP